MHKFLKLAIKESQDYSFDKLLTHRLCAVLVGGGKVLSLGFNKMASNGFVHSLPSHLSDNPFLNTHAEVDAILKVRSKIDLRGCKVYVARTTEKQVMVGLAKPCPVCQHVLLRYGIKRAYYTVSHNSYGVLNIKAKVTEKIY